MFLLKQTKYITRMASSSSVSGHISVTLVTAPNKDVARKLASELVKKRLAACVNLVDGIESIYEWKGKIENDNETLLVIKSHSSKLADLTEFVEQNHPYDCPEVVSMKVESGSRKYLDWVQDATNKSRVE